MIDLHASAVVPPTSTELDSKNKQLTKINSHKSTFDAENPIRLCTLGEELNLDISESSSRNRKLLIKRISLEAAGFAELAVLPIVAYLSKLPGFTVNISGYEANISMLMDIGLMVPFDALLYVPICVFRGNLFYSDNSNDLSAKVRKDCYEILRCGRGLSLGLSVSSFILRAFAAYTALEYQNTANDSYRSANFCLTLCSTIINYLAINYVAQNIR